ncbi:hypothetical protein B5X24_HaOG214294 [Helicoverpa armigera]|nr:hypothetical protein B5X24_HaOG214294 [Helicoverpa armigera]
MKFAILFLLATVVVSTIAESSFRLRSAHMAVQKRAVLGSNCVKNSDCDVFCVPFFGSCVNGYCSCPLIPGKIRRY